MSSVQLLPATYASADIAIDMFNSDFATQKLWQTLIRRANLQPLLDLATTCGFKVYFAQTMTGSCACSTRGDVFVALIDMNFCKHFAGDLTGYQAILAHEMGHCFAYKFGEDYKDESLAWKWGEKFFKKAYGYNVPQWFYTMRDTCLATYTSKD
jgi:hypothetical protein